MHPSWMAEEQRDNYKLDGPRYLILVQRLTFIYTSLIASIQMSNSYSANIKTNSLTSTAQGAMV